MTRITTDILISGGGVAGLSAAAAFGSAGFSVLCVDPEVPITNADTDGADLRTTAFLQPSIPVLQDAGLWSRLKPYAAPLQVMRIIDAGGADPVPRLIKDFDASDISDQPFGWNLPNWLLRREMVARLAELPNVRFRPGVATARLLTRESEAQVTLSDGTRVTARMVIAADGRRSTIRQALGIGVRTTRYGQRRWPLPRPIQLRTGMSRPRFTALAAPSPWYRCPTGTGGPVPPLSGWKQGQKPCVWPPCPKQSSMPR